MLLALDIGNTNIVVGLFDRQELIGHWRLTTDRNRTADELRLTMCGLLRDAGIEAERVTGIAVASVVPSLHRPLLQGFEPLFACPPRFLRAEDEPIPLDVDEPTAVGADRIANCIAAHHRYPQSVLVIDFGTAVTFDLVSPDGAFLGGAIAPEMRLAARALVDRAAQLHSVALDVPESVIGRTTADNLRAGIAFGFLDLVGGLISRFRAEVEGPLRVIATGGKGELFARHLDAIEDYDPFLTLEGLRLWWETAARDDTAES
ncbi:MAG: type III pantothenate kinase [Candidatus Bipolaricaulota bacterium]|nr:MAG: type III pantothenate kinase [Candidatus Bipolaricaulota bacterium]